MNEQTTKQKIQTYGTLGLCASANIKIKYKKLISHTLEHSLEVTFNQSCFHAIFSWPEGPSSLRWVCH